MSRQRTSRDPVRAPHESSSQMKKESFLQKFDETRDGVKCIEEKLLLVSESMEEMKAFYHLQLRGAGLAEMELFYKDKLEKERLAVKDSQEELKSFKDRVAGDLSVTLHTAGLENLNCPVNESRLREMNEALWRMWPKVLNVMKTNGTSSVPARAHLQTKFAEARKQMDAKRHQMDATFDLSCLSLTGRPPPPKVSQYRQLSVKNLQLAVYHSRREDAPQFPHCELRVESPQDVQDFFSRCFWVGCLMALNEPPLDLNWGAPDPASGFC